MPHPLAGLGRYPKTITASRPSDTPDRSATGVSARPNQRNSQPSGSTKHPRFPGISHRVSITQTSDCEPNSSTYGGVVGWSELPTAGNELHHFGWNARSSALCHEGHAGHLERRYLLVPALRSSTTYVLDTTPCPPTCS